MSRLAGCVCKPPKACTSGTPGMSACEPVRHERDRVRQERFAAWPKPKPMSLWERVYGEPRPERVTDADEAELGQILKRCDQRRDAGTSK